MEVTLYLVHIINNNSPAPLESECRLIVTHSPKQRGDTCPLIKVNEDHMDNLRIIPRTLGTHQTEEQL